MRQTTLALLRSKSLSRAKEGEVFRLASGGTSTVYLDVRKTSLSPEGHILLGQELHEKTMNWPDTVDVVAGVALGGCPLASAVSMQSAASAQPLPALFVRKEAKEYGKANLVEGEFTPGARVLLLEDVVTSGGSSLKAIQALREAGLVPVGVLTVVDREAGGRAAFEAAGVRFDRLYTMAEILND